MSRKLDAAIAEALGYQIHPHIGLCKFEKDIEDYRGLVADRWMPYKDGSIPHYSTDGNAMLELDKEMRARGWMLVVVRNMEKEGASARYYQGGQVVTFPLPTKHKEIETAVALTAYKALTGKEWQD